MSDAPVFDARIWQAVVAGGFVAVGWLVNGWQNRREAAAQRAERLRDVHRALFAEIGATLANLDSAEALDGYRDDMLARMDSDARFFPLVPREHGDQVFQAIVAEIHILPRVTIDPIVAYYSQLRAIETLVDDMRGTAVNMLAQERRREIYFDYIEMKKQALAYGQYALLMIDSYARDGRAGAAKVRLSSRVEDPSAR